MRTATWTLSRLAIALATALAIFPLILALTPPALAQAPQSPTRFDYLIRADFLAGAAGDLARFERAMKLCEETLAANPLHAEALVWHGSGLVFLSGQAVKRKDRETARELLARGLTEMDQAAALKPENVGVLIPRAATLSAVSRALRDPDRARPLLETAVGDYEKVLVLQAPYFERLSVHVRGELLAGLAEGWHRLGQIEKARGYLQRIVAELPGSRYEAKARAWLERGPAAGERLSCGGCHGR